MSAQQYEVRSNNEGSEESDYVLCFHPSGEMTQLYNHNISCYIPLYIWI